MRNAAVAVILALVVASTGCTTPIKRSLSEVSPETRIRVWHNDSACCASPLIGTLVNYDADSVRVRVPTQEQPIGLSRGSIAWIQRARRAGRGERGALIGLGVGAAAGGIIGYNTLCTQCDGDSRLLGLYLGSLAGEVYGTLAGLVVGITIRRDVWETVLPQ